MKYRLTCLTPTLVGDGQKLAPIDYMVWKDQVNVLDQNRIFRLLARGPRLEGYLGQLKKAEKLEFASWGGFAQNYAGRRIPFEHASSTPVYDRARAENLFIPVFASGPRGPYLPASALKGAFRTALVNTRASAQVLKDAAAKLGPDGRGMRQVGNAVEEAALGPGGSNAMRQISLADSAIVPQSSFRIYLLRVSTLEPRGAGKYELGWKQAPRGSSKRAEDGTPMFAEMAVPGTTFEGEWHEVGFLSQPEIARALRASHRPDVPKMFAAANAYAERLLAIQRNYAEISGMAILKASMAKLEARLAEVRESANRCVLPIGWGAGLLSKVAFLDTREEAYQDILKQLPYYARAIQSNLPFPKTRRVVFMENQPATLPGFVELEVA
jgi:CRISPR-associated protein Csm5